MLDQRRAEEKGYITLKEAAKIANYTPDYVGQLIRGGKIKGEQVYASVAWVTTYQEVQAYLKDKGRHVQDEQSQKFVLFKNVSSYFLYALIVFCVMALLVMQYILYVSIDDGIEKMYVVKPIETQNVITVSIR